MYGMFFGEEFFLFRWRLKEIGFIELFLVFYWDTYWCQFKPRESMFVQGFYCVSVRLVLLDRIRDDLQLGLFFIILGSYLLGVIMHGVLFTVHLEFI